jgi:uncharacterized protein
MKPGKVYRKNAWISPKVEVRESQIHGKGMFARETISEREIVAIWEGKYNSKKEAHEAKNNNPDLRVQQIEDNVFEVFTKEDAEDDLAYFHNHSCNPNTWMEDEVTISARQRINANEELTIDYSVFETKEDYDNGELRMRFSKLPQKNHRKRLEIARTSKAISKSLFTISQ